MGSTTALAVVDLPEVGVIMTPHRFTKSLKLQLNFNHRMEAKGDMTNPCQHSP